MKDTCDYLIIGGGMVAATTVKAIRERDTHGSIVMLTEEPQGPIARPALSKKLWTDPDFTQEDIWLLSDDDNVALHTRTVATALDRQSRTVTTQEGETFAYRTLLLATGGMPNTLPGLSASPEVLYFRSLNDYQTLREHAAAKKSMVVVGGGYIGFELAAALVQQECKVTLITPDDTLGAALFPSEFASHFEGTFTRHGVTVMTGCEVTEGTQDDGGVTVTLDNGETVHAEVLAAGLGISPNTQLAEQAGLEVEDGIVVDEHLTTSDPHILAAGDVASYPDKRMGRQRVEHVDNANMMGPVAGHNMTGSTERYTHTPYFYSNVFDIKFQAVGLADSRLDVIEDWKTPMQEGALYYLEGDQLKGVMLINLEDRLDQARALLESPTITDSKTLSGALH
ncbi:NAD(P)/FAD-dependent oxidoreductase [Larsenimonas rhizosphaerae]|uniref:FAD/NAD(P)-binding oxidoreductase n=1 Tax=Larsenimonas rhizosphaerae TaxID=2944682 RepID=A0AA41ZI30_9GAMM|nr:FAD/NAD(P)-binding oxidoreductase [Larsenimonas rhizosphaerae]MCX2524579.1 FAD/NAD(P)-binding oxidoreductase [Larsenimonas rhizosphaerae]